MEDRKQVLINLIINNRQMAYFQNNQKRQNKNRHLSSVQPTLSCNNSQSKNSYLKAFKKYYIQKLLDRNTDKENINNSKATYSNNQRRQSQPQNQKISTMTDSTKNSRERSGNNISCNKIVDLVNNNQSQISEVLYNSISQVENQMMTFGALNDLAKENKLLKNSVAKLKLILKQKLQVALKKNKEEITTMFQQYSKMIKKLLEDKESLTNHLQATKAKLANEQKRCQGLEESYQSQIAIIVKENNMQISNTKQQIQQFLEMINQYEEEANQQRIQVQNLREKLVELQMENDRLKSHRGGAQMQGSQSFNDTDQDYISKMKSLLVMINEVEAENSQLKQFLKNCKCSQIQSNQHSLIEQKVEQVINKYEQHVAQIQKEFIKESSLCRQALNKKDQCIQRLNLIIEQLRKQRYESVDRITQQTLKASKSSKQHL